MALTKARNRMIEGASANVKDFGATGDGVTDDTAAIQVALDAGFGTVHFPNGIYSISSITIPKYVIVQGAGIHLTEIRTVSGSVSFGTYTTGGYSAIRDMYIHGTSSTGTLVNATDLDDGGHGPYYCHLENVMLEGGLITLGIDNAAGFTVTRSQVGNQGASIYAIKVSATSYVNGFSITDTHIIGKSDIDIGSSGFGLNMKGVVTDCSHNPALKLTNITGGSITGCYFEGSLDCVTNLDIEASVTSLVISGNVSLLGTATDHIKCDGDAVVVTGNSFHPYAAAHDFITLEANSSNCIIGSNATGGGGFWFPEVLDQGTRNQIFPQNFKWDEDLTDSIYSEAGSAVLKQTNLPIDFAQNGGGMRITASGTNAGVAGNKSLVLRMGTSDITVQAANNNQDDWRLTAEIYLSSETTQRISWTMIRGTSIEQGYDTWSEDTTTPLNLYLRCTLADAADTLTLRTWLVEKF
jgi:hypothetical protein